MFTFLSHTLYAQILPCLSRLKAICKMIVGLLYGFRDVKSVLCEKGELFSDATVRDQNDYSNCHGKVYTINKVLHKYG